MRIKHTIDTSYMPGYVKVNINLEGDGSFGGMVELLKKPDIEGLLRAVNGLKEDLEMALEFFDRKEKELNCLLYTSPSPRDGLLSRMPSSA